MENNDIVYGVHAVTEALMANTGNKLYIQDDLRGKNVAKMKDLAAEKKVSISWTTKKIQMVPFIKVLSCVFQNLLIRILRRC